MFLTGSMLYNEELKLQKQLLDEVTAEAQQAGDKEVYRFDMNHIDGEAFYGNDWHPNIYQDEKMAGELTAYLRTLMNWFSPKSRRVSSRMPKSSGIVSARSMAIRV